MGGNVFEGIKKHLQNPSHIAFLKGYDIIKIELSKNGVGIKHISKRHYESEVLYSHKTKWLVKKIKKDEKTEKKTGQKYTFYHIKYEEV